MPDVDAAREQAFRRHARRWWTAPIEGVDRTGSVTKVYDEAGYLVATANFADLMSSEPN